MKRPARVVLLWTLSILGGLPASTARLSVRFPTSSDLTPESGSNPRGGSTASPTDFSPGRLHSLLPWFLGWGHAKWEPSSGGLLFHHRATAASMAFKTQGRLTSIGASGTGEAVVTARLEAQGITDPDTIEASLPKIRWWRI